MHSQSPIEAEWQLLAIVQVKRLEAACFRTLDGKPWDQLAQLFTPDCEFVTYRDPDNVDPKRRCGRDAIMASVRRTVGEALTVQLHAQGFIACDFFVAVIATFRLLYVFVVIAHHRSAPDPLQRHRASKCRLDAATAARVTRIRKATRIPASRSRQHFFSKHVRREPLMRCS
jgi:hypothetical protein